MASRSITSDAKRTTPREGRAQSPAGATKQPGGWNLNQSDHFRRRTRTRRRRRRRRPIQLPLPIPRSENAPAELTVSTLTTGLHRLRPPDESISLSLRELRSDQRDPPNLPQRGQVKMRRKVEDLFNAFPFLFPFSFFPPSFFILFSAAEKS